MRSFFYNLDKQLLYAESIHNEELHNLCCDVKEFVCQGTFTKYKKAKLLLKYWGETDKYTAEMTGMKEGTIRVTRRNLSNTLYDLFGYDFFKVIAIGDSKAVKEGRYRLSLVTKDICADTFLYKEFIRDIVKDSKVDDNIDIKNCSMEIQFLIKHSRGNIEKELAMLDKNKLSFLIRMLDNEAGSLVNIYNLVKCFEK